MLLQIFSNRVIDAIVERRPQNMQELLAVRGIYPEKADQYGAGILKCCQMCAGGSGDWGGAGDESAVRRSRSGRPMRGLAGDSGRPSFYSEPASLQRQPQWTSGGGLDVGMELLQDLPGFL